MPGYTNRVAIVGAGPAGLTAALAARRHGLEAVVFEQAPHFDPIGGGILLHSNGLRVLQALGLLDALRPLMRVIPRMTLERVGGRRLFAVDYQTLTIPRPQGAVVMRHALEECLLRAALEAGATVFFAHRLEAAWLTEGEARLRFSRSDERAFDLVLACDGVHSRMRDALGVPGRRRMTGQAFLRATGAVRTEDSTLREIWGPGGRVFGICPLPGDQTHFYCSVPSGQWLDIRQNRLELWIESWADFGPEVMTILRAVPDWSQVNYSETSEVVLRRWFQPPVFFVGDAAHAMRPNLGQGANMAMVDAFVLLRLLAPALRSGGDLAAVGRAYEALRRPFVTRVQDAAHVIGALSGWASAPACLLRDRLLSLPQSFAWLRHRGALLTAGYNPREDPYLGGGTDD